MLKEKFQQRFIELEEQYKNIPFRQNNGGSSIKHAVAHDWKKWATSVQNLVRAVYDKNSPHYENLIKEIDTCRGHEQSVNAVYGVFLSAKEDFEGGYVFDVDLRVSGEVFGDFVAMAKQSLSEGHKDVAAVLACSALEDTLKKYAGLNGITITDESMTEVVNALKSKGLVSGAQKSLLDTMPKVRNFAMHAKWEKISEPDVSSVIGFVEQFLLSHFSHS
jgi:hypothetical protein